jgi:superfamily I DNA/RNA helicase
LINIILGPPGTGKTTKLLEICKQKKEEGIGWDKIGFFSFSQKAAYEAKDRAREKFQASREDLIHFRTLHSFAYRNLAIDDNNLFKKKNWKELSALVGWDLNFDESDESIYTNTNHKFVNLINLARLKNTELLEEWRRSEDRSMSWDRLQYLDDIITGFKDENNLYDYTDMIVRYTLDPIINNFDVLFIDEAQDMPTIQYEMIDKLIKHSKETFIAGDDDQAIFRWMGADVDRFIDLKGSVQVLDKSYRCPERIFRLANTIISKVSNRRQKTWSPKSEQGKVKRVTHLRHIDLSEGNWLLLGRTKKIRNEMIEGHLKSLGMWYGRGDHRPISRTVLNAIYAWNRLQDNQTISYGDVQYIYNQIVAKGRLKRGAKTFKDEDKDKIYTLDILKKDHGLLIDGEWYEVMNKISEYDVAYIRRLLDLGEDLQKEPRIKTSTIHQAKGGECDNVVVLTDIGKIVYKSYTKNPDDEHRVFYVAVTRAKENLYIVDPQTTNFYSMYADMGYEEI